VADELVAEFSDPSNGVMSPDQVFLPSLTISVLFAIYIFKV
jgi:hypothetical protein